MHSTSENMPLDTWLRLTYRFNRRFDLRSLHTRLLVAAATCAPQPQRLIRMAEIHC